MAAKLHQWAIAMVRLASLCSEHSVRASYETLVAYHRRVRREAKLPVVSVPPRLGRDPPRPRLFRPNPRRRWNRLALPPPMGGARPFVLGGSASRCTWKRLAV